MLDFSKVDKWKVARAFAYSMLAGIFFVSAFVFVDKVFYSGSNLKRILKLVDSTYEENSSKGESVNLLDNSKKQEFANVESSESISLVSKSSVEKGSELKTKPNKETSTVIIVNGVPLSKKGEIDAVGIYANNLYVQGITDYPFFVFNKKGTEVCSKAFSGKKVTKVSMFDKVSNLDFVSAMETFKKVSATEPSAKLFILGDTVSPECNSEDAISRFKNVYGTSNRAVYVVSFNETTDSISDGFMKRLASDLGINYVKVRSPSEMSALLNSRVYPIESGIGNLLSSSPNAEISFLDSQSQPTNVTTTVYQKKGSVFQKYGDFVSEGLLQLSLLPGIYYFESFNEESGLKIKTEPRTINDSLKYKDSFTFRKTKLSANVFNEKNEPVLSDFTIKDPSNGNFVVKESKGTSAFVFDLMPGKYLLEAVSSDGTVFEDEILADGKEFDDRTYTIRKGTVNVKVTDEYKSPKADVTVKIYDKRKKLAGSGKGSESTYSLGGGTYEAVITDVSTGNSSTKEFTITSSNPTLVEVSFQSVEVSFDFGKSPKMAKFYTIRDYESTSDADALSKLSVKTVSGSGKMKLRLLPGDYAIDVFDFEDNKIGTERIEVNEDFGNAFSFDDLTNGEGGN